MGDIDRIQRAVPSGFPEGKYPRVQEREAGGQHPHRHPHEDVVELSIEESEESEVIDTELQVVEPTISEGIDLSV